MAYIASYFKGGLLYQGEYIIDCANPLKAISPYYAVPFSTDIDPIREHVPIVIFVGK